MPFTDYHFKQLDKTLTVADAVNRRRGEAVGNFEGNFQIATPLNDLSRLLSSLA